MRLELCPSTNHLFCVCTCVCVGEGSWGGSNPLGSCEANLIANQQFHFHPMLCSWSYTTCLSLQSPSSSKQAYLPSLKSNLQTMRYRKSQVFIRQRLHSPSSCYSTNGMLVLQIKQDQRQQQHDPVAGAMKRVHNKQEKKPSCRMRIKVGICLLCAVCCVCCVLLCAECCVRCV